MSPVIEYYDAAGPELRPIGNQIRVDTLSRVQPVDEEHVHRSVPDKPRTAGRKHLHHLIPAAVVPSLLRKEAGGGAGASYALETLSQLIKYRPSPSVSKRHLALGPGN